MSSFVNEKRNKQQQCDDKEVEESSMIYYQPTMPSQVFGNQSNDNGVEGTDDDIPHPSLPTLPSEQQPQGRQRRRPPCGTATHR